MKALKNFLLGHLVSSKKYAVIWIEFGKDLSENLGNRLIISGVRRSRKLNPRRTEQ
jgi:hypothetical protein